MGSSLGYKFAYIGRGASPDVFQTLESPNFIKAYKKLQYGLQESQPAHPTPSMIYPSQDGNAAFELAKSDLVCVGSRIGITNLYGQGDMESNLTCKLVQFTSSPRVITVWGVFGFERSWGIRSAWASSRTQLDAA